MKDVFGKGNCFEKSDLLLLRPIVSVCWLQLDLIFLLLSETSREGSLGFLDLFWTGK